MAEWRDSSPIVCNGRWFGGVLVQDRRVVRRFMAEILHVEVRTERGKRRIRRLRASGKIPAILYGHGEETISLSAPTREVDAAIRHGSRVVELEGGVKESALIREVQWNALGTHVLHLDLTRVSATERVKTEVHVELVGDAPGVHHGGILDHALHTLEIECSAASIPDKITLKINDLQLDQVILAGDLQLPEGVDLVTEATRPVVSCTTPIGLDKDEEAEASEGAEPEIIGRKADDEEGDSDTKKN